MAGSDLPPHEVEVVIVVVTVVWLSSGRLWMVCCSHVSYLCNLASNCYYRNQFISDLPLIMGRGGIKTCIGLAEMGSYL